LDGENPAEDLFVLKLKLRRIRNFLARKAGHDNQRVVEDLQFSVWGS